MTAALDVARAPFIVAAVKRFPLILVAFAVVALIAWAAVRSAGPKVAPVSPGGDELADVPRTSLAQAAAEIQKGNVTVIDVRDADSYVAGHIPGSLQIPLMRIEGEVNYLPRDKPILTYCT